MEKILLFMNNPEKSEMITECLRSYYKIIHAENGISDYLENDFILLITDLNSWTSNKEILKNKKHGEEPIFLPYLLVTSFETFANSSYVVGTFNPNLSNKVLLYHKTSVDLLNGIPYIFPFIVDASLNPCIISS